MVHFVLGISSLHGVSFSSIPHKPEWETISWMFGSHIYYPSFYSDLSNQLQEVIEGKRQKFAFDERQEYEEFVPGEATRIKLSVYDNIHVDDVYIEIDDFYTDKKIHVKAHELKIIVDNWIKFVEVNTKAFGE